MSANARPPQTEDWTPCPPGGLADLGTRLRTAERSRGLVRAGGIAAVALAMAAGAFVALAPPAVAAGVIACHTAIARFEAYHAHLTGGAKMAAVEAQEMVQHFATCRHCRARFQRLYPGTLGATLAAIAVPALWFATRRSPPRAPVG